MYPTLGAREVPQLREARHEASFDRTARDRRRVN